MTESAPQQLTIERVFEAPRELVFAHWIEPEHLGAWFAPAGFAVVECAVDGRRGGRWRVAYRSREHGLYVEHGEFIDVLPPERLRFTLINEHSRGQVMFRTEVQITFEERDGKTTMRFSQRGFASRSVLDSVKIGWAGADRRGHRLVRAPDATRLSRCRRFAQVM